jgi:uncharacterized cupredoxin-like copper-binding protein
MNKNSICGLALIVGVLVAPVSGSLASAHTKASSRAHATTITVKGGEFFFKLSTRTLAAPGRVTFVFTNVGHVAHDFKIKGKAGTAVIEPGKSTRLVVTFKKGSYTYLCTVPGHAEAGMKGIFKVR